jgi:glyoxylase-like metal-dependent hydrolase (beta-lactamase superfamily II)
MLTTELAPGVHHLDLTVANAYFIREPGKPWFLIDTGIPGKAETIQAAAQELFGMEPPAAILLTHGHGDHAGSVLNLAKTWNVPVYLHPAELPFLTGKSSYPPPDATVGGFMAFLSRFMPLKPFDLSGLTLLFYPPNGICPAGLNNWQWIHTPGHAPGHISLFRDQDRVLIVGDAFVTMDLDSLLGVLSKRPVLARPTSPTTFDWPKARQSVTRLAALQPLLVAAGHGQPISGPDLPEKLQTFAATLRAPPSRPIRANPGHHRSQRYHLSSSRGASASSTDLAYSRLLGSTLPQSASAHSPAKGIGNKKSQNGIERIGRRKWCAPPSCGSKRPNPSAVRAKRWPAFPVFDRCP